MNNPTRPYIMVIVLIVISSTLFLNITHWQTKYTPLHVEYEQQQEPIITGMSPTRTGTAIIFFNRPEPNITEGGGGHNSYVPPVYYNPPKIDFPYVSEDQEETSVEEPEIPEQITIVPYVLTTNLWGIFTIMTIALLTLAVILLKRKK